MKKFLLLFLIAFTSFSVISCTIQLPTTQLTSETTSTSTDSTSDSSITSLSENVTIDLYAMNDFHGGAYDGVEILSNIGNYLAEAKESNPNTIVLSSGDMFQGTSFSNYYYGLPIVEAMNSIGFVSFTLGNHEFDWGIDKIANYSDGDETNGEASFKFLAANVVYQDTQEELPWTEPYTIVTVDGVRVGIIGVIGEVIDSISASRVTNIEFLDPVDTIYYYADILRTDENVDIVVASIHDYEIWMNNDIAQFTGTHKVDAIFNGHSHTNIAGDIPAAEGVNLPYAQCSNYSSSLLAKITLVYNRATGLVTSESATILGESQIGSTTDTYIDTVFATFEDNTEYQSFINEVLTDVSGTYYRNDLAPWGSDVIKDYVGVDVGVVNSGGFRTTMNSGTLTMGDLVVIYPFDNYIKTVELTGAQLKELYANYDLYGADLVFSTNVTGSYASLYVNGVKVIDTNIYTVAAVDYVFDKTNYQFLDGDNITQTSYLMRDLLKQDLLNSGGSFSPLDGSNYPG